jgi:hypothetical protein
VWAKQSGLWRAASSKAQEKRIYRCGAGEGVGRALPPEVPELPEVPAPEPMELELPDVPEPELVVSALVPDVLDFL